MLAPQGAAARSARRRQPARAPARPLAQAPGGAQEGEAHLLELGRQSGPPEDLGRLGRRSSTSRRTSSRSRSTPPGGAGVAQEAGRRLRGRRRARRHQDRADPGAGLLRQRHPRSRSTTTSTSGTRRPTSSRTSSSRCARSPASRCCTCRSPSFPTSCSTAPTGSRRPKLQAADTYDQFIAAAKAITRAGPLSASRCAA